MEQKLSTVLAADLVSEGSFASGDPARPSAAARLVERTITEHDGRLYGGAGDRTIAEFASVVMAMRCALRLQQQGEKRSAEDAAETSLRIGLCLGDVFVDGSTISGDGIEIAVRLKMLAEPGEICVSGGIYDQVEGRMAVRFDFLGEQVVGDRRVRTYRAGLAVQPVETPRPGAGRGLPLPAKPSVAVLPFVNMSGDPDRNYFSDGITEDIITELSRFRSLFVIAPNSSFAYRDPATDAQQVGRELGVQFLLEGSIRTAGPRVRITAQLVDAATGQHLWSERYDRNLEDIFAVQDEVARTIVATLVGRLQDAGAEQAKRKRTENLAAYDYLLRGMEHLSRYTQEDNAEARRLLEQAVALDPAYAQAWAGIASTYLYDWIWNSGERALLDTAYRTAARALDLDEAESWCHMTFARVCLYRHEFARAEAHSERAVSLNPNDAHFAANMGLLCTYLGRPDDGVAWVNKAMRLNPHHPDWYCEHLGLALYSARRYAEAVQVFKRISAPPFWIHAYLAGCLAQAGEMEAARAEAAQVLRLVPEFTTSRSARSEPFKLTEDMIHWTEGLQRAGLPA